MGAHARCGGAPRVRRESALTGPQHLSPTDVPVSHVTDRLVQNEGGRRPSLDLLTAADRCLTDGPPGIHGRRVARGGRPARSRGVDARRRPGTVCSRSRGARDRPVDDDAVRGLSRHVSHRDGWGQRDAGRTRLPHHGVLDGALDFHTGMSRRRRRRRRGGRIRGLCDGGRRLDGRGRGSHRSSLRRPARGRAGRRSSRSGRRGLRDCGRRRLNGRRTRRRTGRGSRRRDRTRRQQPERVGVALLVGGSSDPEVDGRDGLLRRAARADRADRAALGDRVALRDDDRPEVDERDGVPVRREDRDAAPVGRQRARERHDARRGRSDGRAVRTGDVDAAVLPTRVGVRAERERAEDRAVRGPRPGCRLAAQGEGERRDQADRKEPVHSCTSFVLCDGNAGGER